MNPYHDSDVRANPKIRNPDTGVPEDAFRRQVREALGLGWDARDAQILARLKERMLPEGWTKE